MYYIILYIDYIYRLYNFVLHIYIYIYIYIIFIYIYIYIYINFEKDLPFGIQGVLVLFCTFF